MGDLLFVVQMLLLAYDEHFAVDNAEVSELFLRSIVVLHECCEVLDIKTEFAAVDDLTRSILISGMPIPTECFRLCQDVICFSREVIAAALDLTCHFEVWEVLDQVVDSICTDQQPPVNHTNNGVNTQIAREVCVDIIEHMLSLCSTLDRSADAPVACDSLLACADDVVVPMTLDMDDDAAPDTATVEAETSEPDPRSADLSLSELAHQQSLNPHVVDCLAREACEEMKGSQAASAVNHLLIIVPNCDHGAPGTTNGAGAHPINGVNVEEGAESALDHCDAGEGLGEETGGNEQPDGQQPVAAQLTQLSAEELKQREFEELYRTRKAVVERSAEARATAQFRQWQRERVSLEAAIEASLKDYGEFYEKVLDAV